MKKTNKILIIGMAFLSIILLSGFYSGFLIFNSYNPVNTNSNGSNDVLDPLGIPPDIITDNETGTDSDPPFENSTELLKKPPKSKVSVLDNSENWNKGETVRVDYLAVNKTVKQGSYTKSATNFVLEWGSFGTGNSEFDYPYGIAIDSNNDVYVVDSDNDRIQVFDTTGTYLRQWGTLGSGDGQFRDPKGIAIDENDEIYVTDGGINDRVQVFNTAGTYQRQWGSSAILGDPSGIIVDNNNSVFVTDAVGHLVNKFSNTGTLYTQWGSYGTGNGEFKYPYSITVDKDDNIFVGDAQNHRVQKFDNLGNYISQWGTEGTENGQMDNPQGIGIDTYNNIYVLDRGNDRVQKFDSSGNFIVKWGTTGSTAGKFDIPFGFTVDNENNFYVVDRDNYRVQKFETILTSSDIPDVSQAKNDDSNYLEITEPIEKEIIAFSESIFTFTMYDVVNPSSIGIKINWFQDGKELFLDNYTTTNLQGVYSGSELVITVHFLYSFEDINVTLSVFDTGTNTYSISSIESSSDFVFGNHYVDTYGFDYIWTERGSVSSNFRSWFRYVNNSNFEHNLEIDVVDFRIPFEVYAPLPWNFTNIIPTADVTLSGNNYIVSNTLPTTYSMTFLSGPGKGRDYNRQKQILAIKDVTADYLSDPSFENNFNQWNTRTSTIFNSMSLNYSIVSDGVSSIRLEDLVTDTEYFGEPVIETGEYYISFDYYIESITVGTLSFEWWDNPSSATKSIQFPSYITNRWHTFNGFFHQKVGTYDWIRIMGGGFNGIVFLDNFRINKVNTVIETSGNSETTITSQFNYWTSYGLYFASNENVTLQLRDRTANTLIDSYSEYTDSLGTISWTWKGKFQQKENELRSIAWNSFFGLLSDRYTEETAVTDWTASCFTSETESLGDSIFSKSKYSYQIEGISNCWYSYVSVSLLLASPIDASDGYLFGFDIKLNTTTGWDASINNYQSGFIIYDSDSGIDYLIWHWKTYASIDTFTGFGNSVFLSFDDYTYKGAESFDLADIDQFSFRFKNTTLTSNIQINIDQFRLIKYQSHYFTPQTVGFTDYAETELNDRWDFSEGDKEFHTTIWAWSDYETIDNGNFIVKSNGLRSYMYGDSQGHDPIDSSYWNQLLVRFKTNSSGSSTLDLDINSDLNAIVCSKGSWEFSTITDQYITVICDLTIDPDWKETQSFFRVLFRNNSGNFDSSFFVFIDEISLFHSDSSLDSGYSLEFEQDGYNDNFGGCLSSDNTKNGYVYHKLTSTISYCTAYGITGNFYPKQNFYFLFEVQVNDISDSFMSGEIWSETAIISGFNIVSAGNMKTTRTIYKSSLISSWTGFSYYKWFPRQTSGSENILFKIFSIRIVYETPPNLYETSNSFILDNENQLIYNTWIDGNFWGTATSWVNIPKNLTTGSHTFRYQAFDSGESYGIFLPSVVYEYSYTVTESDIMKIIYYDQSGLPLPFDRFKTFIDSVRLYDQYTYFTDTSITFDLQVTDLFDNNLINQPTATFEQFKELQITLYSVKIINTQPAPIWLEITRGAKTFSEWVLTNEIVEFPLESSSYNFTIIYSDVSGSLGSAATNGTVVSFIYAVTSDSALIITGYSIQDVFNNVVSLTQDLTNVNASLSNQIINVDVNVGNINTSITNQIVNVDINLDNINSTLGSQLVNIDTDINNLQTNITLQITDVDLKITNMNSTLYSQTVTMLTDLYNINSTLYSQTVSMINQIQNLNSTFGNQSIDILNSIENTNSTLYNQSVSILEQIAYLNNTFRVHFDLIDHLGIGIDWNIFVVKINDIRIYNQDQFFYNGTPLSVSAFDYFGVEIFRNSYSITEKTDISVEVDFYEIIFQNSNLDLISKIKIVRNGYEVNFQIAPDTQQIRRFTGGIYKVTITYDLNESQADLLGTTSGEKTLSSKSITFGSRLKQITPEVVDASPPDIPKPFEIDWLLIVGIVLYTFLTAGMGYLSRTRFWKPLDDSVDSKGLKKTVQDPIVSGAAYIPNLILNQDKRDETHKSIDQKRNSRNRD